MNNVNISKNVLVRDWICLVPPTAALAGIGYMSYLAFCPEGRPKPSGRCNLHQKLDETKIVDSIDIEDIAEKAAMCRCWKSNNVSKKNTHTKRPSISFYNVIISF